MVAYARRVLVVDDDRHIREMVAEMLEYEGYAVATAADGLAALDWLAHAHADVIVLDYAMPRCDAPAFVAAYRARPGAAAPIVLLTAAHDVEARCRRVRADGCLGKPFDLDVLLAVVAGQTHTHEPISPRTRSA